MKKRDIILSVVLAFVLAISSVSVFYAEDPAGREDDRGLNIDPISISPSSVSINRGQSYQLNAILKPEYFGVEVNWSSSNTSVATIREGLVTGLSAGTATITAVMNELVPDGYNNFATCTVTVSSSGIIANGTYFIENVNAGKYIDVEGPSTSNGAKMQLWELTGATQRKWTVTLGTDGYYRIKSNYSNKYMRVTGSSSTPGATITQNSSIVNGSKWSFMITSAGNYAIVPASSISSLVVLNAPGTTNGYDLNTAVYSNNSDYKDEWKLTRMLPTNGSEITYGVDDWDWYYDTFDNLWKYNNCYAYAINNQIDPEFDRFWNNQQPGAYYYFHGNGTGYSAINAQQIISAASNDFSTYNSIHTDATYSITSVNNKYSACSTGSYRVALVIAPNQDFHWYRQDADGLWSHKLSSLDVSRTDAAGNMIIDPELANHNYSSIGGANYTLFCGFFEVTPWNNMRSDLSYYSNSNNDIISELPSSARQIATKDSIKSIQIGCTNRDVVETIGFEGDIIGSGALIYRYILETGEVAIVYFVCNGADYTVSNILIGGNVI